MAWAEIVYMCPEADHFPLIVCVLGFGRAGQPPSDPWSMSVARILNLVALCQLEAWGHSAREVADVAGQSRFPLAHRGVRGKANARVLKA